MTQLSYGAYVAGHHGEAQQITRSLSRTNGVATQKTYTLTIDTATNAHVYTITLTFPGQLSGIDLSYTADGSATATEIRDGLQAAWNASAVATGRATATDSSTDALVFTANAIGIDFTITEADAKMSLATSGGGDPDLIPFGRLVIDAASGDGSQCREASSTTLSAKVVQLTPLAVNNAVYYVNVTVGGVTYNSMVEADGSATVKEILDAFTPILNALLPDDTVLVSDDDAILTLTAEVAGLDFDVSVGSDAAGATWTVATTTEGPGLTEETQGLAIWSAEFAASEDASGNAGYPGYKQVSVMGQGTAVVNTAESVSPSLPVYYGTTGADQGTWRSSVGTTAANWVQLDPAQARWVKRLSSSQALLSLNLSQ